MVQPGGVMEGAVCTAVPVPDRALPKDWRGRGERAGSMAFIQLRREGCASLRASYSSRVGFIEPDAQRLNRGASRCMGFILGFVEPIEVYGQSAGNVEGR